MYLCNVWHGSEASYVRTCVMCFTLVLVTAQSIEDLEATIESLREKREGIKKEMDEQVGMYVCMYSMVPHAGSVCL